VLRVSPWEGGEEDWTSNTKKRSVGILVLIRRLESSRVVDICKQVQVFENEGNLYYLVVRPSNLERGGEGSV